MRRTKPIPQKEWEIIVRNVPIVSVDLIIKHGNEVLLGKRVNEPAKGEWFVPGGTVFKHEQLEEAVHRISREELDIKVSIDRKLGVYEHFYDESEFADSDGKHYVPIGYLATTKDREVRSDGQHSAFNWYSPPFDSIELHRYVEDYFKDACLLND